MAEDSYPFDVGSFSRKVSTESAAAQKWFDRGSVWLVNFHREEASFCFTRATEADPTCAMAWWGLAYANGPDYNFHEAAGFYMVANKEEGFPSLKVASEAAAKAVELSSGAPARERALSEAMNARYAWPVTKETPALQQKYADAMAKVAEDFPDDAEVQAAYAEALMCLLPWNLYDKEAGSKTPIWYSADKVLKPVGRRAKEALERALAASPSDPWAAHLMIHLCEMGPVADFNWQAAEAVRSTDAVIAGHLLHMPTHLDIQVGDYKRAMEWNIAGYKADLKVSAATPERTAIYGGYILHNMEFCAWAAMYGGCKKVALEACGQLDKFVTEESLRKNPFLATYNEAYTATTLMVQIRFGLWEDILATQFRDAELYVSHTLLLHYARGIALGVLDHVEEARAEQQALAALMQKLQPGDRIKHNVNLRQMGEIAEKILAGEILYRAGDYEAAFVELEKGVALFDALPYDEPHGWLMSPRQTLGALLTEQGRHKPAAKAFEDDLSLFPKNPWALAGLSRCYAATEDSRHADTKAALQAALELADISIGTSCACAKQHF